MFMVFCFCEEEMLRTLVIVLQSDALESSSSLNQLHFWSWDSPSWTGELSFILRCLLGLELHVSL